MARQYKSDTTPAGPSQRQLRVGEMIRRSLADLLTRGDHFEPDLEGKLISVSEVRTSPDLRVAKVFVYPHGGDDGAVLEALNRIRSQLRTQVTKDVQLKYSPELRFELDQSFDLAEQTLNAIDRLDEGDKS